MIKNRDQKREKSNKLLKCRNNSRKSIFQTIFVPLIFVMILQAFIFYIVAVYGGVESSLNQNAADILSEKLTNRKNEIENKFNKEWTNLDICQNQLDILYNTYQQEYGEKPFVNNPETQIAFINDSVDILIQSLRENQTNGIFLILNDKAEQTNFDSSRSEVKYGCNIRDLDSTSAYTYREDLLLERMPSSIVDQTGCSLDSWWESVYTFNSEQEGGFFYNPLNAAWQNPGVNGENIAYVEDLHRISRSDQPVISYSLPLLDSDGKPYAVLGVELTSKYLGNILPNKELGDVNKTCYVLAQHNKNGYEIIPCASSGSMFNYCFRDGMTISCENKTDTGGFVVEAQNGIKLYGTMEKINVYNNNNPFEDNELVLLALIDKRDLFSYSQKIKNNLLVVAFMSLVLGFISIFIVSRRFAAPITALAQTARDMEPKPDLHLQHLGIAEIDQLVDSIESLNKNVNKEIARTEFFSRMSHDMRTPMNAIISFSSKEMLEGTDELQKDDYLNKIHNSGQYLLGLINEVLDMTKIESQKVVLDYANEKVDDLWNTVCTMVDKLAEQKNIHFERNINMPSQVYAHIDKQHLNQVVLNLLSNAVKFTNEGGTVILQIDLVESDTTTYKCKIQVKDNGIGISDDFMKKLYKPFAQEVEGQGGTGLGLSISKKLVDLMGGTINCTSKKGEGTTFVIDFTFDKVDDSEIIHNDDNSNAIELDESILKGKQILMCEDQPLNIMIARKLLESKGMIVTVAENGKIGVERFKESKDGEFDAILMDIRMPEMNGIDAAQAIRALNRSDSLPIPIIAMTADAFENDMQKSINAGMNAHLSKPVVPQKLFSTLTEKIKEYRK